MRRKAPPHGPCPVRRTQRLLDRARERVERRVGPVFDEQGAVGKRDEAHGVAFHVRRIGRHDRVGLAWAEVTGHAGLLPERPLRWRRARDEPAFAREALVQRLTPPEEAHPY